MKTKLKQIDLARRLQCSRQAVSALLKRPDAPQPDRGGLYDVKAVCEYVNERRILNNDAPDSKALLAARIENLRLENQLLREKLRIDRPAFSPENVEELLREFLNENHCQLIGCLNNIAYVLASEQTTGGCLKLLHEAQNEAEGRVCQWMEDHKLTAPNLSQEWPIPSGCFGWWFKGKWRFKANPCDQKPNEGKETDEA
jgi:hypothetical protein